jgi:sialate O-acetylesterase
VANGPEFSRVKFNDGHATLSFRNVDGGLEARGGELRGFSIAGEDGKFVWANATIKGDQVVVSSPSVTQPKAVRFGWADFPVVNLYNKVGLPATPFRTDDWPMVTRPKPPAPVAAAKPAPAPGAPKAE